MKKIFKISILIVIAAAILFLLDWCSGIEEDGRGLPPLVNPVEKAFYQKCDGLRLKNWDKNKFEEIKNELHTYGQQGVITVTDASKFENFLYVNYAKSMVKTCDEWIVNDCGTPIEGLNKEMVNVSSIGEYKIILASSLELMKNYNSAISLPARVKNHISIEYIQSVHESIQLEISHLCNSEGIKSCTKIRNIQQEQIQIMEDFKGYVKNYNECVELAKNGPGWPTSPSDDYTTELKKLCPKKSEQTKKYLFYYNQIKTFNICE